jgi:tRNA (mo5U34)-methyltransferase
MPSRGFSWRGFKLRVSYPKRRRSAPIEAYEPATPPVVQPPVRRDPQRALDFLRDPSLQGDGKQPNPITQKYLVEAAAKRSEATSLAQLVAGIPWYHTIELGDGVVTPGSHDHRNFVNLVGLPEDLTGKRVLDVATFDGFWAFEFERRGAEVVAIDLPSTSHLDLPGKASDIVKAEGLDLPHGEAFHIAHQALKSKAKWLACSVYDLDPAVHGTFDLVFVGDVLLHLRNSLDALRRVRDVARDRFIMVDRYDPSISGTGERLLRYEGGWNGMEWWAPSLETLQQWVVDAGFAPPTMHGTYQVRGEDRSNAGWFRAVLHSHVV